MNSEDRIIADKLVVLEEIDYLLQLNSMPVVGYEIKSDDQEAVVQLLEKDEAILVLDTSVKGNDTAVYTVSRGPSYDEFLDLLRQKNKDIQKSDLVECVLRFDDVTLYLKIGENEEHPIGKVQDESVLHQLLAKICSYPNTYFTNTSIFPSGSYSNLWQIFTKSRYSYLRSFFETKTKSIKFVPTAKLSKAEINTMLSQVTAKYRKSFE